MCVRHLHSAALALAAGGAIAACDKTSRPSEVTDQEVSSREVSTDASPAARAIPSHFSLNGPFGNLSASSYLGAVYRDGSLQLYPVGTDEAYVYYVVFECDLTTFDCGIVEEGYGYISGEELTTSRGRISVKTNTADNPSFDQFTGSGGLIDITWTELSGYSYRSSTQSRYRSPGYSSHWHGTFTVSSALAEGSFLGIQLEPGNAYAEMGTVKDGGMTITR